MTDTRHVKGLAELQKFLDQFPPKLEANVMRGAMRAGVTQEILPEVQAGALSIGLVKTGEYMAGLKAGTRSRGGVVTGYVKARGKHGFLAHIFEYGARAHTITAKFKTGLLSFGGIFRYSVDHPGIRPKPHFRPALDRRGGSAVIVVGNYIKNRLARKHGIDTAYIKVEGDE